MSRAARYGTRTDTLLLGTVLVLAAVARGMPERLRDPIAATMRRTVVAPLIALQQSAELTRHAIATHETRTAQRDSVALQAMAVGSLQRENERLRRLLGLARQLRWGFVPAEALHTRGIGEEFQLTLTAGSNAGVKPFAPVIAPEGLVGMVQSVDPTMSTAIIWPHPDFRVSAMAADGSAFGIVAAHLGGGAERYLLEMRGVQYRNRLDSGTVIVSSGLGGVYPRGIPIGAIIAEIQTQEGWARTYLLRPAVRPPDVSSIMILRAERAEAGVENVWAHVGAADSADRRVAAAADSIARSEAAAEAAIRRLALERQRRDSVRADSIARLGAAERSLPAQPPGLRAPGPVAGAAPVASPLPSALDRRAPPVRAESIIGTDPGNSTRRDDTRSDSARRDRTDTVRREVEMPRRDSVQAPDTSGRPPPSVGGAGRP